MKKMPTIDEMKVLEANRRDKQIRYFEIRMEKSLSDFLPRLVGRDKDFMILSIDECPKELRTKERIYGTIHRILTEKFDYNEDISSHLIHEVNMIDG